MKVADGPVTLELNGVGRERGYLRFRDYHKEYPSGQRVVYVHQLCAIADGADPYKVFSDGAYETNHTPINDPLCNWRENVELVPHNEHWDYHVNGDESGETGKTETGGVV